MSFSSLLWLTCLFSLGSAYKSPGPCPSVPPSHLNASSYANETFLSLIHEMHSFHPSYLVNTGSFRNIMGTFIRQEESGDPCIFETTLDHHPKDSINFIPSYEVGTVPYAHTMIPLKCNNTFKDTTRIWFDSGLLILWGCNMDNLRMENSQTLMIAMNRSLFQDMEDKARNSGTFNLTENHYENLKVVAKKYLGNAVDNMTFSPTPEDVRTKPILSGSNITIKPFGEKQFVWNRWKVIVILMMVVALILVMKTFFVDVE